MNSEPPKPYLSIILPTYNVGKHIDRCITSCINQDYNNIEIIVVDDCGNDDSIEKAKKWASTDDRLKIIYNSKNIGTYHARRRGVEMASGKYILFLDPDDEIENDTALRIYSATSKSDFDIIFFGKKILSRNNIVISQEKPSFFLNSEILDRFLLCKPKDLGTPGKAYRREVLITALKKISVPEEVRLVYAEDALLFFGALCYSKNSITIPFPCYRYHLNDSSITRQQSNDSIKSQQSQIDIIIKYINKISENYTKPEKLKVDKIRAYFELVLLSTRHMLARKLPDENGNSQYLKSVTNTLKIEKSIKSIFRIAVYILSFKTIKL